MNSVDISPPVIRSAPDGAGIIPTDAREWGTYGLIRPPLLFSHHIHDFRVDRSAEWIKPVRIISERGRCGRGLIGPAGRDGTLDPANGNGAKDWAQCDALIPEARGAVRACCAGAVAGERCETG